MTAGFGFVAGEREIAAVGLFGCREVGDGLGDLGGEEDVFGGLGGKVQGGEKVSGGVRCGFGVEVETGDGAEGAGFEGGVGIGESGGGAEFGAGFFAACVGRAAGAGEEQAEGYMRGREERVGGDGLAVVGLGGGSCWLLVVRCWLRAFGWR